MLKNWFKKKSVSQPSEAGITWDEQATQALETAIAQAPVPQLLKGKLRTELKKTAEAEATKNGRQTVTAEDLFTGLMAKLPAHMQDKVKKMISEGKVDPNQLK